MSEKKTEIRKEIEGEAPLLSGLHTQKVTAPPGYFDTLAEQVTSEVAKEELPVVLPNRKRAVLIWAIAASFVGLIGLTLFLMESDPPPTFSEEGDAIEGLTLEDRLLAIDDDIFYEVYFEDLESEEIEEEEDIRIEYLLDSGTDIEELLTDYSL